MNRFLCALVLVFTALNLSATDLKDKAEVNIGVGGNHLGNNGGNHGMFDFGAGWGVAPKTELYGDYNLTTCGSGCKLNDLSGGIKVNIKDTDKYDPFVSGGLGFGHFSGGGGNHFAFHLGFGVRIYLPAKKNKWGVTPEVQYGHYFASAQDLNVFRYGAGVFYQWGK
jgi:hypothetical protein